ncbi:hypothetical protein Tco_0445072 [Tanacetum coccineum]
MNFILHGFLKPAVLLSQPLEVLGSTFDIFSPTATPEERLEDALVRMKVNDFKRWHLEQTFRNRCIRKTIWTLTTVAAMGDSPELIYPGVIMIGSGPELMRTGAISSSSASHLMNPQDSSLMKGFWMSSLDFSQGGTCSVLQVFHVRLGSRKRHCKLVHLVALPLPSTLTLGESGGLWSSS